MTDTKKIRRLIKENGLRLSYIAEMLGLTTYGLSRKINNINEFKSSEISALCEILQITSLEEKEILFFAKVVDLKSTIN